MKPKFRTADNKNLAFKTNIFLVLYTVHEIKLKTMK